MANVRLFVLCVVSILEVSSGLFLGGDETDSLGSNKPSQLGFERNQDVYSHLVIPPWSRPFKIGYCKSWEWSTDKRYREARMKICEEYGKGKHECESPSGCHDKCPYVNGSYPFWRLRNAADVPFLWVISGLKFYETSSSSKALVTDPAKAYASSYFGPGYKPSNAFDNNRDTIWVSNGAAPPGMQWIGFEFPWPVYVGSIHLTSEEDKPERNPSMIYVEASCEKYFRNFVTQWIITNPTHDSNKRFSVFNMAKFTNLGSTGRKGPTTVGMHYQGQDHDSQVTIKKGIQIWKVPATGTYAIEAVGAAGGYDKFTTISKRGRGARVKGNFHLKRGDLVKILVGQEGGANMASGGAGGGGGTFVVTEDNRALIVAGGGGGIDKFKGDSARCHGTTSQDGNPGYGGAQFRGGSNGKGAEEGDNNYSGGGGGGFESDGRSNSNFGGSQGTGGEGGKSFYEGGVGGRSNQNDVQGGFGGGGGPNGAGGGGGGGGGYSGGASGSKSNSCGGGGGSFNAGSDQSSQAGVNVGQGYVIVKLLTLK